MQKNTDHFCIVVHAPKFKEFSAVSQLQIKIFNIKHQYSVEMRTMIPIATR